MNASHLSSMAAEPSPIGPGRLVLVVGPSGAGKDTVIARTKVLCANDSAIVFPRRIVTRPGSDSEDNDTLSEEAFDCAVASGGLAFWWSAHGLKYGIPRIVDSDIRAGRTPVCNVSRAIVSDVRTRYCRVDTVLVTAPTACLRARLAGRSRSSDGNLADRIQRNDVYAEFCADYVIDNIGTPDEAAERFLEIIKERATLPALNQVIAR